MRDSGAMWLSSSVHHLAEALGSPRFWPNLSPHLLFNQASRCRSMPHSNQYGAKLCLSLCGVHPSNSSGLRP